MNINRDEILSVNGLYISQLYKHWYAAECIAVRNGRLCKIRYPYKTPNDAINMLSFLNGKRDSFPKPNYRIQVYIMNNGYVR